MDHLKEAIMAHDVIFIRHLRAGLDCLTSAERGELSRSAQSPEEATKNAALYFGLAFHKPNWED